MKESRILLLRPSQDQPSAADQSLGARLAASRELFRGRIGLEEDSFRGGLEALERTLRRWEGRIAGVVGATGAGESRRLGGLAQAMGLLCFVANNNPSVWQDRDHLFHIGAPTPMSSAAVADALIKIGVKRLYLLHDRTEFQQNVAKHTEACLEQRGAEVRSRPGGYKDWLDEIRLWRPDLLYLVYSNEALALPLALSFRSAFPTIPLLVGRSLLRQSFIDSLGAVSEGLLGVDIFNRPEPKREGEMLFLEALQKAGIETPTANHGFGWDATSLCALALGRNGGDARAAVAYLESGVELEGATGYYRFSRKDHNGRAGFNPTLISRIKNGRVENLRGG